MFLSLFIIVEFFGNFRQILAEIVHNFILRVNSQSQLGRYSSRIIALSSRLDRTWQ